jgi:F1F0 ATPase subunit 2
MNILDIAFSFVVGLAMGALYFGALWLTVSRFTHGGMAPAWLLVSAVIRLACLVGVLFWIAGGQVSRLLAALAGFLLVRFVVTWPIRSRGAPVQAGRES